MFDLQQRTQQNQTDMYQFVSALDKKVNLIQEALEDHLDMHRAKEQFEKLSRECHPAADGYTRETP